MSVSSELGSVTFTELEGQALPDKGMHSLTDAFDHAIVDDVEGSLEDRRKRQEVTGSRVPRSPQQHRHLHTVLTSLQTITPLALLRYAHNLPQSGSIQFK